MSEPPPRRLRIALVYDAVFPWVKGGGERLFFELARRLARRHEVHLFGMQWWKGPRDRRAAPGVWLHGVCRAVPLHRHGRRSISAAARLALALPRALWRQGRFDVLNVISIPYLPLFGARLVAGLLRTPVVVTWLEYWEDHWRRYLPRGARLARRVESLCLALSPSIIVLSAQARERMVRAGLPAGRIEVVPPGVDWPALQELLPVETRADVLFAGRLIPDKRLDLLLSALALIERRRPDVRCAVIGDGEERARHEAHARRLGLEAHVRFLGFLPESADVYRWMKASRVLALPSEREGFGLVALEAAACGLPVVTTDAPENAAAALVREGGFGLVSSPDPGSFAAALLLVLEAPDRAAGMARRGIEWSRGLDWEAVARRTEAILLAAAAGGQGRGR